MTLKPQDIIVALKLLRKESAELTFKQLAGELGLSVSETHQAFHRAQAAGLISHLERKANPAAVAELLIHGLKYMMPVQAGRRTRGMVTGFAAPPLSDFFGSEHDDLMVWPDPHGECAGWEIKPLINSVPKAAKNDPDLYELLVLADALRGQAEHGREKLRKKFYEND